MTAHAQEWFTAVQKGDLAAVEWLLAAEPGLLGARDERGLSAVTWSCYARREAIRARLLAAGAPLDVFEAVAAGVRERALALLDAGPALVHAWSPDGFTPLHLAAYFAQHELAADLLARGADASAVATNGTSLQPLHSAAASGALEIARALLAHGADPDARQAQGFTALMSAAQQGNEELVTLLLGHGADAGLRCDDGRAAADFADQKSHHALAARLRA